MKWMVLALLALSLRSFAADTVVFGDIPEDAVVLTGTGMTNLVNSAVAAIPAPVESDPSAYPVATNALAQAQAAGIAASNAQVKADAALTAGGGTNVALSVVGAFATTGTVSRAVMADMLRNPNGKTWIEFGAGGALYVYQVTNTPSCYVVSTSGVGYNGPNVGDLWSNPVGEYQVEWMTRTHNYWLTKTDDLWSVGIDGDNDVWNAPYATLPVTLNAYGGFAVGTLIIDWVPATNRYQIADAPTVITISQNAVDAHNSETNTAAHPTLARQSALAGYVATTSIPGAGCTLLSGATPSVTGATVNYLLVPSEAYTLSVATNAPRYNYSLAIQGTNACTFAAGISLVGAWTPSGTNLVVLAPCTGTLWRAYGRAF